LEERRAVDARRCGGDGDVAFGVARRDDGFGLSAGVGDCGVAVREGDGRPTGRRSEGDDDVFYRGAQGVGDGRLQGVGEGRVRFGALRGAACRGDAGGERGFVFQLEGCVTGNARSGGGDVERSDAVVGGDAHSRSSVASGNGGAAAREGDAGAGVGRSEGDGDAADRVGRGIAHGGFELHGVVLGHGGALRGATGRGDARGDLGKQGEAILRQRHVDGVGAAADGGGEDGKVGRANAPRGRPGGVERHAAALGDVGGLVEPGDDFAEVGIDNVDGQR